MNHLFINSIIFYKIIIYIFVLFFYYNRDYIYFIVKNYLKKNRHIKEIFSLLPLICNSFYRCLLCLSISIGFIFLV